jgi:integrase
LEWERIDLATSRITLYRTKSGKPRGVPMNSAVYDALVALEPGANGRHGRPFQRKSGGAWGQIRTIKSRSIPPPGLYVDRPSMAGHAERGAARAGLPRLARGAGGVARHQALALGVHGPRHPAAG